MILNSKVYDILKWVGNILLPAISVLYGTLGDIWGLPFVKEIPLSLMAIATFINAILKVSSNNYFDDKIIVERYDNE